MSPAYQPQYWPSPEQFWLYTLPPSHQWTEPPLQQPTKPMIVQGSVVTGWHHPSSQAVP